MTERERALWKGKKISPLTENESAIAYAVENGGGGGSDLPDVTAADNGDVLTVVEGAWAKAEPSGGGDALIVTATFGQNFAVTNISASYADVKAAAIDNKPVYLIVQSPSDADKMIAAGDLTFLNDDQSTAYFSGVGQHPLLGDMENFVLEMVEDDGVTSVTLKMYPVKPTYSFGFTITAGQTEGELIATPDSGSTYAAITAALAETPNVYAVLDLGFQHQVIRALFSVDSTVLGAESTSAIGMFWSGTKWMGARLMVNFEDTATIIVRET